MYILMISEIIIVKFIFLLFVSYMYVQMFVSENNKIKQELMCCCHLFLTKRNSIPYETKVGINSSYVLWPAYKIIKMTSAENLSSNGKN